jgi:hypothetical protein
MKEKRREPAVVLREVEFSCYRDALLFQVAGGKGAYLIPPAPVHPVFIEICSVRKILLPKSNPYCFQGRIVFGAFDRRGSWAGAPFFLAFSLSLQRVSRRRSTLVRWVGGVGVRSGLLTPARDEAIKEGELNKFSPHKVLK